MMKTSDEGIVEIAGHEGIVLEPYYDSVRVLTVGIGHTASAGAPDPKQMRDRGEKLTLEDAITLFGNDLEKYEDRVNRYLKAPVQQHQFDAAVSFDYNTGAIHKAWWVNSHNDGDYVRAANQIMNWKSPPEIIGRREREQRLYRDGTYDPSPTQLFTEVSASGWVNYGRYDLISDDRLLSLLGREPNSSLPITTEFNFEAFIEDLKSDLDMMSTTDLQNALEKIMKIFIDEWRSRRNQ